MLPTIQSKLYKILTIAPCILSLSCSTFQKNAQNIFYSIPEYQQRSFDGYLEDKDKLLALFIEQPQQTIDLSLKSAVKLALENNTPLKQEHYTLYAALADYSSKTKKRYGLSIDSIVSTEKAKSALEITMAKEFSLVGIETFYNIEKIGRDSKSETIFDLSFSLPFLSNRYDELKRDELEDRVALTKAFNAFYSKVRDTAYTAIDLYISCWNYQAGIKVLKEKMRMYTEASDCMKKINKNEQYFTQKEMSEISSKIQELEIKLLALTEKAEENFNELKLFLALHPNSTVRLTEQITLNKCKYTKNDLTKSSIKGDYTLEDLINELKLNKLETIIARKNRFPLLGFVYEMKNQIRDYLAKLNGNISLYRSDLTWEVKKESAENVVTNAKIENRIRTLISSINKNYNLLESKEEKTWGIIKTAKTNKDIAKSYTESLNQAVNHGAENLKKEKISYKGVKDAIDDWEDEENKLINNVADYNKTLLLLFKDSGLFNPAYQPIRP